MYCLALTSHMSICLCGCSWGCGSPTREALVDLPCREQLVWERVLLCAGKRGACALIGTDVKHPYNKGTALTCLCNSLAPPRAFPSPRPVWPRLTTCPCMSGKEQLCACNGRRARTCFVEELAAPLFLQCLEQTVGAPQERHIPSAYICTGNMWRRGIALRKATSVGLARKASPCHTFPVREADDARVPM